jgi:hypothetical protein
MDEWETQFKPISNHLDTNASFQDEDGVGIMFETYGEELEFVSSCLDNQVWSYLDNEDGGTVITQGLSFNAPIGYFVTKEAWNSDQPVTVLVSEES